MSSAVVTILFTDLVGSTELLRELGEDAAEQLRRELFRLQRRAVADHGGEEVKTIGDSLMVAFSSPAEAVGCAVDMQRAIDAHNRSSEHPLALRIGINAGEATREDGDYFGTPVVIAKRLCDAADGGRILASELLRALVGSRGGFTFKEYGSLPLKGIDDPVPACEIAWEPAEGAVPLPALIAAGDPTPFVGRASQRDALDNAFARARDGRRTIAMIAGEPGIGKTRLAFEFARAAHGTGAIVLYGHCEEQAFLPYQPFVEALRFVIATSEPQDLASWLGPTGGDLARVLPDVSARVPDLEPPLVADPEVERYRLFDAVAHLLGELARTAPIVLLLDDLQWADAPTLSLLTHVLRWPAESRLLIVGTYRDVELDRRHPLADVLAGLRRDERYERVALHGLSRDEVESLVRERAHHDLSTQERRLVDALHAETEGNPFFIREIIRHLVEIGALRQDDDGRWTADRNLEEVGLPEGVREVIGRRLARLSDACNEVLRIASVIGRSFDLRVLERASERDGTDLLELLQEAVDARVLHEVHGAIDRYTFAHALIGETLSAELTTSRRVRLHAQVGTILEGLGGDDPPLAELAYHFHEAAAIAGNEVKSVDYSRRAGDRAREMLAYEEAAGHYHRALATLDEAGAADPETRAELGILAGFARRDAGDISGARRVFDTTFEFARARGDADVMGRSALGYAGLWSELGLIDERTLHMLEQARDALPAGDNDLRARLLARLGIERIFSTEPMGSIASIDEALAMARRGGDRATIAYALLARAHGVALSSETERSRAAAEEAIAAATEIGKVESAQRARAFLIIAHVFSGDMAGYERERARFHETNDIMRKPFYRYVADLMEVERSIRSGWTGDDERLKRIEQGASDFARATGGVAWTFVRVLATLGTPSQPDALAKFRQTWGPLVGAVPGIGVNFADLLELAGESEEARRHYEREISAHLALTPESWLYLNVSSARLAILFEDRNTAATLYDRFLPFADYHACAGPTALVAYYWPFESTLGALAGLLGRHDEAVARLERGVAASRTMDGVVSEILTRCDLARALVQRGAPGDAERARAEADAAVAEAERVGHAVCTERARALRATL